VDSVVGSRGVETWPTQARTAAVTTDTRVRCTLLAVLSTHLACDTAVSPTLEMRVWRKVRNTAFAGLAHALQPDAALLISKRCVSAQARPRLAALHAAACQCTTACNWSRVAQHTLVCNVAGSSALDLRPACMKTSRTNGPNHSRPEAALPAPQSRVIAWSRHTHPSRCGFTSHVPINPQTKDQPLVGNRII
jgi:hypothetical protein